MTNHELELIKHIQVGKKLQESLNSLRVSIKYLLFDLEATRREKEAIRKENVELLRKLSEA